MLEVGGLSVGYGRTTIIRDLELSLADDRSLCVLGRNGVGKTTLLNAIAGLLRPSAGTIRLFGEDVTSLSADRRVRLGLAYVPQGRGGFPGLTVMENLMVAREAIRGRPASAIDDALDLFPRLVPLLRRRAGVLSGGQQQQLAIARALTLGPSLLLLDEPTEGIQPSIIDEIEDAVLALRDSAGIRVVLVEQFVDFALRLADDYIVMSAGRIAARGDAAELDVSAARELLAV